MKWLKDNTGRFPYRPFFSQDELDYECEFLVTSHLSEKHGKVSFPIATNDLTIIVEKYSSDLDVYADLTKEGNDVEGITAFVPSKLPQVFISQKLSGSPVFENRFRTTLAHELGHVKFHSFLLKDRQLSLFANQDSSLVIKCMRDNIITTNKVDWMEWQAGYASGAFLMPITHIRNLVLAICSKSNSSIHIMQTSATGRQLIEQVSATFQVSSEAARVRLSQLNFLIDSQLPEPFLKV